MKRTLIEVGKTYHNGKSGRFYGERKVIGAGSEYLLYSGQMNADCLRYEQVAGQEKGNQGNITRISFATWAKGVVTDETH